MAVERRSGTQAMGRRDLNAAEDDRGGIEITIVEESTAGFVEMELGRDRADATNAQAARLDGGRAEVSM